MEATVIIQATVKKSNVKFNFEVFQKSIPKIVSSFHQFLIKQAFALATRELSLQYERENLTDGKMILLYQFPQNKLEST